MDSKENKKLNRFLTAINTFGTRAPYFVDEKQQKQLERDLDFMNKKYEEGGRWQAGKLHAQKALFKRIFK